MTKEINMAKSKEITYLVKVQRENNKNSWKTYCECETLQLAEKVAHGLPLSVPYHIARKTIETTFEMIEAKN